MKKNLLKDLIYIQENKPCTEQTIKGLFRAILEPVLESGEECLVIYRLNNRDGLLGVLQRLGYVNATVHDFSGKVDSFEQTEFLYVLSQRYGASLVWDSQTVDMKNHVGFYLMYNSKNLSDSFDIINANSETDLSEYPEKWKPERRDNISMNASIRKIIDNLTMEDEELVGEFEHDIVSEKEELEKRIEFLNGKSRHVAHEIRNQLSICDLYSNIIAKKLEKEGIDSPSIMNAVNCIKKSVKLASNNLTALKSVSNEALEEHNLKELIDNAVNLSKVYVDEKDITLTADCADGVCVLTDENKFLSVLVNLLKNAIEAIEEKGDVQIICKNTDDNTTVCVLNNGKPISKSKQEKIFEDGFTTKAGGVGVGLYICKKFIEEMYGQLILVKSDKDLTEFRIVLQG